MVAFSDELQKIAKIKTAIIPAQLQSNAATAIGAAPANALGFVQSRTVKKDTSTSAPKYSKVQSVSVPQPSVGIQPTSASPAVKS